MGYSRRSKTSLISPATPTTTNTCQAKCRRCAKALGGAGGGGNAARWALSRDSRHSDSAFASGPLGSIHAISMTSILPALCDASKVDAGSGEKSTSLKAERPKTLECRCSAALSCECVWSAYGQGNVPTWSRQQDRQTGAPEGAVSLHGTPCGRGERQQPKYQSFERTMLGVVVPNGHWARRKRQGPLQSHGRSGATDSPGCGLNWVSVCAEFQNPGDHVAERYDDFVRGDLASSRAFRKQRVSTLLVRGRPPKCDQGGSLAARLADSPHSQQHRDGRPLRWVMGPKGAVCRDHTLHALHGAP